MEHPAYGIVLYTRIKTEVYSNTFHLMLILIHDILRQEISHLIYEICAHPINDGTSIWCYSALS